MGDLDHLGCGRVSEPEDSQLVARHPRGSAHQGVEVRPANAPMPPDRNEREISPLAKIDHVLARRIEDPRRFPGRQQLILIRRGRWIGRVAAHIAKDRYPPKTQ